MNFLIASSHCLRIGTDTLVSTILYFVGSDGIISVLIILVVKLPVNLLLLFNGEEETDVDFKGEETEVDFSIVVVVVVDGVVV